MSTQLPDEPGGNEHLALNRMGSWPDELRGLLERACFANFLDMVYAIDASPPTVPAIKIVASVWDHRDIGVVTPHGAEHILVYVVPEWDEDEHMEWCFRGDRLLYVGQFLDIHRMDTTASTNQQTLTILTVQLQNTTTSPMLGSSAVGRNST